MTNGRGPQTKLPQNEFTRFIIKGPGLKRGARGLRGSSHSPEVHLDRLNKVPPAGDPSIISVTKLIRRKQSFIQNAANDCLEPKVQNAALCKNVSFSRSEIGCVVPVTSSFMVNCDLELSTCFSAIS